MGTRGMQVLLGYTWVKGVSVLLGYAWVQGVCSITRVCMGKRGMQYH